MSLCPADSDAALLLQSGFTELALLGSGCFRASSLHPGPSCPPDSLVAMYARGGCRCQHC